MTKDSDGRASALARHSTCPRSRSVQVRVAVRKRRSGESHSAHGCIAAHPKVWGDLGTSIPALVAFAQQG